MNNSNTDFADGYQSALDDLAAFLKARKVMAREPHDPTADTPPSTIGDRVKRARIDAGLSQSELADAMCSAGFPWSQPVAGKTERGNRKLPAAEVVPLAHYLGVDPLHLLG